MREYVLTLLVAAAVTYVLTPLVRRFAIAVGAMHAARDRDVHVVPTPLLGGFAMYAGLAAGLVVASQLPSLNSVFADTNMARGLLLAGGLVVVMGFVDDRWGMGVISKLAGQVAAGVILVWSGAEVTWLPAPGSGTTLGLTSDQQIAVTILVVVVTINAVNFIDGLDGLAAGIVGIGAAAFFAYYYTLTHRLGLPDQAGPALASAVLAGICLGFLPHNFHPARIFMGDTGAMLIGLLLAYAPISSLASLDPGSLTDYAAGTAVNRFGEILPLLLPAAIMLIPYADLLMAVIRRTRAGMSPFAPGPQAPASPHARHRPLAPDQRPDHVPVGGPVRGQRGMAVDRPDPAVRAGHRHRGRHAGAAARVDAAAAPVGAGRRRGPPPGRAPPRRAARAPARPPERRAAPCRSGTRPPAAHPAAARGCRAPAPPDPEPAPPAPAHRHAGPPRGPGRHLTARARRVRRAWRPAPPPPQAAPHPARRRLATAAPEPDRAGSPGSARPCRAARRARAQPLAVAGRPAGAAPWPAAAGAIPAVAGRARRSPPRRGRPRRRRRAPPWPSRRGRQPRRLRPRGPSRDGGPASVIAALVPGGAVSPCLGR